MDIATLRDEFCAHATFILGYSPDTIRRYRSVLRRLERWSGFADIAHYTPDLMRAFFLEGRRQQRLAPNTFITYQKTFEVFLSLVHPAGRLDGQPGGGD